MKKIFKFAMMAIAMMAVTTTMLTSCGDDNNSSTGGGSKEDTHSTSWLGSISSGKTIKGTVYNYTFSFEPSTETISDVTMYYGEKETVQKAYDASTVAGLTSVKMTNSGSNYTCSVDVSTLTNIWTNYIVIVKSKSGKTAFLTPHVLYDASGVALDVKVETSLTADSIQVKVSGTVPAEVRSNCPVIGLCTAASTLMNGYEPSKFIGEVCKVNTDGTFSQKFNLDRTTKSYTMIFAAGKMVDGTFTYLIYNKNKTFELPKK